MVNALTFLSEVVGTSSLVVILDLMFGPGICRGNSIMCVRGNIFCAGPGIPTAWWGYSSNRAFVFDVREAVKGMNKLKCGERVAAGWKRQAGKRRDETVNLWQWPQKVAAVGR